MTTSLQVKQQASASLSQVMKIHGDIAAKRTDGGISAMIKEDESTASPKATNNEKINVKEAQTGRELEVRSIKTARGQLNLTGTLTKAKLSRPKETGPPKCGAYTAKKTVKPTQFRVFYERGDLPISLDISCRGPVVKFKVDILKLDFHHYLPLFFDGLRETKAQYNTIAYNGAMEMLTKGGSKVPNVIPQLIIPIKEALNTREDMTVCRTLKCLQTLCLCHESVGELLVPYYRQILPAFNALKSKNKNTGDGIDYSQMKKMNVGDLIHETLHILEEHGGPDAFINIKYMIPVYESCI